MEVRKNVLVDEDEIKLAVLEYLRRNYPDIKGAYQTAYIHGEGNGKPPFMSFTFMEDIEKVKQ